MMKLIRFCILLCLLAYNASAHAQKKQRPNVLFIISDDLTATSISSYGNSATHTPHIDRLASEGIQFTKSYCQYPVCGPSRASMLFGYYPSATQTYGYISGRANVGNNRKSWPQLFKDNGYYTARVSKIYHMAIPADIEKGTDGTDDEASWTERFNSQGEEWKSEGAAELVQNNPYGKIERRGGNVMTIVKSEGGDMAQADGKTAQKAIELIKTHKNQPFFLAVGLVRPHVPFVAPKEYFTNYPYNQATRPPQVTNDWDDIPEMGINYVTSVNAQMSAEQEQKAIAAYYSCVSFVDAQVGKILKALKDEGLEDNTIVIFTSDHGFHLGEHRFWMKVSLMEESVRVPMIIKVPGKQPAVCNSLVELLDLYPTVAELAGLKPSPAIQGKSLVPIFKNPQTEVRDEAFSVSLNGNAFLIRTHKWAFIQYKEDATGGIQLFDMEYDEKQFNNLAQNPAYKTVVESFQTKLKEKLKTIRQNDLGIDYKK
ncbi:MAG: sulfatase [Niabella sp.]